MGWPSSRRSTGAIAARVAAALGAGAMILVSGASVASAYTVLGATFLPDHGAPHAAIVVVGLPLAIDCPVVDVWLAPGASPSPSITSSSDPRLLTLAGTVRIRPIGAGGVGDTRPATTFEFRVPAIQPGTYATYAECHGGTPAFEGFGPGATMFTVEPAAPETSTDPAVPDALGTPPLLPAVPGSLALPVLAVWWSRRSRRNR
jgi:hypothetical protein